MHKLLILFVKIMKTYFLTYGDRNFHLSKKHLLSLAKRSGYFDFHIALGPNDLDYKFKKKYKNILKHRRGGGYWIWKHRIIDNLLREINKGDTIVYCDAGASINITKKAKQRYFEYIAMLNDSDYSNFRMQCEPGFIEKYYTYKETFDYFKIKTNSRIGQSLQFQAGHMMFKKNEHAREFFNEYELFLNENPYLITDNFNQKNQIDNFIENRHDQSIFSMLSKTMGSVFIQNETEFRKRPNSQYDFPFLSVRSYGHGPKDYLRYYTNPNKFTKSTIYFE